MRYVSTRGGVSDAPFSRVLLEGLAPDGGLYLPAEWPRLTPQELAAAASTSYAEITRRVLELFVGDALTPEEITAAANADADSFSHEAVAPLRQLGPNLWLMELFHGPTLAFKDCAMQLVAPMTAAALKRANERLLLLTATSGDTGAAAVRAFAGADRASLAVLHPKGRVSDAQRRQMTTVDAPNILNLCVRGDFDDCQRMVKALLSDPDLREGRRVSSVNSINWGRVAGQIPYYIAGAAPFSEGARFVVPTGNFGDAFAGWAAKAMGAPIVSLTAAVNQNDALARALSEGRYVREPAEPTASVSMDVQAPSNFERLVYEASGHNAGATKSFFETFAREGAADIPPDILLGLRGEVSALSVSEEETAAEIANTYQLTGELVCPHTAVALSVARRMPREGAPIVALATAHPAKFPEAVERAAGVRPNVPPALANLVDAEERVVEIDADVGAAKRALTDSLVG